MKQLLPLFFIPLTVAGCLGPYKTTRLEKPATIHELPCKDFVAYHANGNIARTRLSAPWSMGRLVLPSNTVIGFTEDEQISCFFLDGPAMLQGHLCKGSGDSWMITVHPDGALKLAWLEKDEMISGVPCRAASVWRDIFGGGAATVFHANGALARCRLSCNFTYGGRNFNKGDELKLDEQGRLAD